MKIAIDISPLQTGHKVRGTGFYLSHLKDALTRYYPQHQYIFFTHRNEIPQSVDVIHYPYFEPFFLTLPSSKDSRIVVTVHDLTPLVLPDLFPVGIKGKVKWQVQKRALRNVTRIITDSYASRKDIVIKTGISEEKVDVVYLAAGEEFQVLPKKESNTIRKKFNLPDRFILYVGDVTPNKNLPRIIDAANATNIPMVLVGKMLKDTTYDKKNQWNKDLAYVQEKTRDNKLFTFPGFVTNEELVQLYNSATCLVMPSLYEGFGLPIIEAMQSGCPVITSKEGSLCEVAGNAALFVDAYSTGNLVDTMKKIMHDTKLQESLTKKGLLHAKRFTWKKVADQTIESYEKAL